MKKAVKNNNIYAEAKEHALAPYRFAVEGSYDAEACVVFADVLSDAARTALEAACAGIGFADPVFLDASVFAEAGGADGIGAPSGAVPPPVAQGGPLGPDAAGVSAARGGSGAPGAAAGSEASGVLGAQSGPSCLEPTAAQGGSKARAAASNGLFEAVEALDPLLLVVADASAAALMGGAYREPVGLDAHGFLFGRPYAAFSSFQRDLSDARSKQRDWALFKAMRKSADWLE